MKYTTTELARLLKQSPENLRVWTIEFSDYLSESAAPVEKGKHRSYSDEDMSVLTLVADCKDRGLVFEQIHKLLKDGERLAPKTNPLALVTHQEQLAIVQLEFEQTKHLLTKETERAIIAEGQVILLERQLATTQERLEKLLIENAILRMRPKNDT